MKPQLVLHAGMGKTGTTALQEFFWRNRAALARAGIAYPETGAVACAHHLISPHVPSFVAHNGWRFLEPQDWAAPVAALGQERILMSSELIAWAAPEKVAAFCAALAPHFDLHLCLYLRRQDNIIMAGYNQQIKAGTQIRRIDHVLERQLARFDYLARIRPWEEALGTGRIIIRPYEQAQFRHGDLIRDFLDGVLGITHPEGFDFAAPGNANPRFAAAALEYKRLVNVVLRDVAASERFNAPLIAWSSERDPSARAVFHDPSTLATQQRAAVLDHFAATNREIARRFLGRDDGVLFTEPLEAQEPPPDPGAIDAALPAISGFLRQHAPALHDELRGQVAAARADGDALTKQAAERLASALDRAPARPRPADAQKGAAAPLVVHFGTLKTGSSSIQETLYAAGDALGDVDYVAFGMANASLTIRNAFMRPERLARRLPPDAARNPERLRRLARERLDGALAALAPQRRAILSAEIISHLTEDECSELVAALRAAGKPLEFHGYLRDPVSYYRSAFAERLKTQAAILVPESEDALALGYHRIVQRLDALVGAEAVRVHPFDPGRFPEGDVVRHFLREQGVDAERLALHHANEGLPSLAVKALYTYRRHGDANDHALGDPPSRQHFVARLAALDSPAFRLHPDLEARIARANAAVIDWSETRLGERLEPAGHGDEDGFRDNDALERFTRAEIAQLAEAAGPAAPARAAGARDNDHATAILAAMRRSLINARPDRAPASKAPATPAPPCPPRSDGPELVIHFGMHKTGSSSIQHSLARHADRLAQHTYLGFGRINGSPEMDRLFRGAAAPGGRDPAFRAALDGLEGRTGVISAEVISVFGPRAMDRLFDALARHGVRARFIGYVREPIGFYTSMLQQTLKTQRIDFDDPESWFQGAARGGAYYHWIDRLIERAGAGNVRAFAFEPRHFPGGSVVAHFLGELGLDPAAAPEAASNESLSATAIKALHAYRSRLAPRDRDERFEVPLGPFLRRLRAIEGPRLRLAEPVAARIRARHPDFDDWARERLLRPDASDPAPPAGACGAETIAHADDLARFSPEETERLACLADMPVPDAGDADAVARIVAQIRSGRLAAPAVQRGPRNRTRLHVHFGMHKTGSSSIQQTLAGNADRLGGTRFLELGRPNASALLRRAILPHAPPAQRPRRQRRAQQAEAARAALRQATALERLEAGLNTACEAPQAILSAEAIAHFDAQACTALLHELRRFPLEPVFIGYIRDPASFAASAFQQRLKRALTASFDPDPTALLRADYHGIVPRLDALVGESRVRVFPFRHGDFPEGDVVRHFLDETGIDAAPLALQRSNDGLPAVAVKALYCYRKLRAPRDADHATPQTAPAFLSALRGLDGPGFRLHPDLEAAIEDAHREVLDWSQARLGTRLAAPERAQATGIRIEADLMHFDDAEQARLARLAAEQGCPAPRTPEQIADLLHQLRVAAHRGRLAEPTPSQGPAAAERAG